jgi:hypothetical protein
MKNKKNKEEAMSRPGSEKEYGEASLYERRMNERAFHRAQQLESFFWKGVDPRRRVEIAEGGMVKEDPRAMANLSESPIHREYPRRGLNSYGFGTNELFDTIGE